MEGKGVLEGRYEMGRVLGHGNFGRVHAARDVRTGRAVAMKVVSKDKVERAGMAEQIKREIAVMKMVSHPSVVELHEVMATRTKVYLALELVRGGELFDRIARHGRVGEGVARSPRTCCSTRPGTSRFADFGLSALACHARPDGLLHSACGTPAYVAPEVLAGNGYDGAKADLWSCGVILYVLLAGALPFQDDNLVCMYRKMRRGDFCCPPWVTTDARKLIKSLLDPNPGTRITVAGLLETPWFRKTAPVPRPIIADPAAAPVDTRGNAGDDKDEPPEVLNAFHLISLSEGFDLSPLFEHDPAASPGRATARAGGTRFATREAASGVVARLEALAMGGARVAPSLLMVDVKKDGGDAMEYRPFFSEELRPALKDIVWSPAAT
ncbi:hypothetical protein OsJ_29383 [Oryza sativa Japonica Group]|uniref:non-specific serine/threonine protein kinase n=1 Tax=Oryza sativa subsp. japonica TaxID=39947 RepID=B9G3L7_ORYSJ|nr:hypothetical protein OsJ_29383 [Oryza sativa Japonica Group]